MDGIGEQALKAADPKAPDQRLIRTETIRRGTDPAPVQKTEENMINIAIDGCGKPEITIEYRDGIQVVLLDGENVNEFLRTPRVSDMASRSSANPDVRAKLLELQKDLARRENVVMDGRDIGTVVLPDAQVKIFLTASVDVRADRRYRELIEKGEKADLDEIKAQIKERDERDMNRPISPLKQAEDAVLVDTSDMTIDEVVAAIMRIIEEKI